MDVMDIKIGPQAEPLARKRDLRCVYTADRQSTSDFKKARKARKKAKSKKQKNMNEQKGYCIVLVLQINYSQKLYTFQICRQKEYVVPYLILKIYRFGCPSIVNTDQDSQMRSVIF
ncbi:hypothetical protein CDAR_89331 [Caerostris darwini]|uniref:Uncharacterized protein n=1 Tax=Caerostris darwini TaxID=1538125 RepID=A0AAV4UHP1_9ARAC|nr:hypothetical protein CDAR_89331 [Caerostris darwini]